MPDEVTARFGVWLAEAAEGLGARLRRAGLSRDERRQGRLLLQRAFDALAAGGEAAEGDAAEGDAAEGAESGAGSTTAGEPAESTTEPARAAEAAVDLPLLRALDAAAWPLTPAIPRPPRIGVPPLVTNPDPEWLAGFFAVEALADTIAGRTERILDGLRDPEVRRAIGRVVTGPGGETDLTLTRG